MTARIPFTVIGGFLGAGKTTLLNHWLHSQNGRRTALLVNDFGELNIDASLIAQQHADTLALTNGCVCCNLGDDLSQALIQVLDAQPPFESVVVEASGVSDPGRIAQLAQAAPELKRDAVLVLVDASMLLTQVRDPLLADTLERQLRAADLLILNKIDLIDQTSRVLVLNYLATQVSGTPVVEAVEGRVPPSIVTGLTLSDHAVGGCGDSSHERMHLACDHEADTCILDTNSHTDQYETWSAHPSQIWTIAQWREALRVLDDAVLRLKGLVRSHEYGWTEIQWAGRRLNMRPAVDVPDDTQATLVAIGLRSKLSRDNLDARLLL